MDSDEKICPVCGSVKHKKDISEVYIYSSMTNCYFSGKSFKHYVIDNSYEIPSVLEVCTNCVSTVYDKIHKSLESLVNSLTKEQLFNSEDFISK